MENNILIKEHLSEWSKALDLFARTTGLTVTLYLPDGERVCGPFGYTPMFQLLHICGVFDKGSRAQYAEQRELFQVATNKKKISFEFSQALRVNAIPIMVEGQLIAIAMIGWFFDHFPDPIECDRLSKELGLPPNRLWQMARLQAPISQEKYKVFEDMLYLLTSTLSQQLMAIETVKEASRVKDELLSIISHELKTPLTSLLLRIQMLRSKKVEKAKMESFLKTMEMNAKKEAQLIDDLLDAASLVAGKYSFEKKPIDLQSTLSLAVQSVFEYAQERELAITFKGVDSPSPYLGDPMRLKQVITSLLNNSIKFTPEGGSIEVSLKSNSSNYEIQIQDNGQGISKEFIPQLFEIFSQGPRKTGSIKSGLGLGLALAKNIIDLHEGKIAVQSMGENLGTKFQILLPKTSSEGQS